MNQPAIVPRTETVYRELMDCSSNTDNDHLLASIIASWAAGKSCLADWMGLGEQEFHKMMALHFPGNICDFDDAGSGEMEAQRYDERDEVYRLLIQHRAGVSESETWVAQIVTAACQGQDHLWQDLGVWSRKDLSLLLSLNFPSLAAKNDKDMKWKKFIYKQLCLTEGIYTCRAPSCEECVDYNDCFGPEE